MDKVPLIVSAVSISLAIGSAVFSFITYVRNMRHDRKQATLDAFNRLQKQVFDQLNLISVARMQEIAADPHSEEYRIVSGYLARLEHFCVGVNQKIYDKKTVYALAHGYLDGFVKSRIEPMLVQKNRRAEKQDTYYANIRKLLLWMDKENEKRKQHRAQK